MNNTEYFDDKVQRCETVEEFKNEIMPELKSLKEQWANKINQILEENKFKKSEFAEICETSRQTVIKWCKGSIPKKRETFIKIGLAAQYGLDEMNLLLQRYGRYSGLYSKSLEDCVCIFVLQQNYGKDALKKYQYILNKIKDNVSGINVNGEDITTAKFDEKLAKVNTEDELEKFITDNIALFSLAYRKLYSKVKMEIGYSTNYEMAIAQNWSSSMVTAVSEINQMKWYPQRNKVISLAMHLSMDVDGTNELLALAHMEPLCPKNIYENAIIFVINDTFLNGKDLDENGNYILTPVLDNAREIFALLGIPELMAFLSEKAEKEDE